MFLFKRNGIYYLQYQDESENRLRRISTKSRTKPEALKFLSEFQQALCSRKKNNFITLSDFQNKYLSAIEITLSPKYSSQVKYAFEALKKEIKGDTPLAKINSNQVEKFLIQTFQRTQSVASLYFRILNSAFQKAIQWNYILENPFRKIRIPKPPKKNPVFLSEYEFNRILENEPRKDLRDFYIIAFFTGLRLNEIVNLQWKSINFNNREVKIENTNTFTTKNKVDRIIPMNNKVFESLQSRFPKIFDIMFSGYVFEKIKDVKFNGDYVSRSFKKAVIKAKLDSRIHFHTLRHSFASNLIAKGVSLYVVKELLGHQDYSTTQIYSHLRAEDLRSAVNVLNN